MSQDPRNEGKRLSALKALEFVEDGSIVGVGTGSTVAFFIEGLADMKSRIKGAVSSSEQSTRFSRRRESRCSTSTMPAPCRCTWTVPTSATRMAG